MSKISIDDNVIAILKLTGYQPRYINGVGYVLITPNGNLSSLIGSSSESMAFTEFIRRLERESEEEIKKAKAKSDMVNKGDMQ
jgi:hypothetical protein